ncbi:DnaJ family domain-containing protein [Heyndrickxia ginsengihumi]|uniref:DnaJ family domain-containing protein n=1 Tax=Heyndrickxia ginsengihumi TaxID=363870 RepID=UPI003D215970
MDFTRLVEEKIREATRNGAFDHLSGYGKPLPKDDLAGVPADLKMGYRILKNAGFSPGEANIKKELMTIEDLIKQSENELEKEGLQKQLNEKILAYNQLLSKNRIRSNSSIFKNYQEKIEKKLLE